MITKVTNFSNKSFRNYTGPEDDFRSKNIIFGYNGSGKSSLVLGLENAFLGTPGNAKENVRVYSANFINNFLLLNPADRKRIKGIKASFGEKNVAIEKEIIELESRIIDQIEIDKISSGIKQLEGEIRNEISKLLSTKKGTLRIQGKPASQSISETIKAYKEDLANALKVEPDANNIKKYLGDDTIEKRIAALESLNEVPEISPISIDFQSISDKQEQSYSDIEIPNSTVVKWLKEGLPIHEGKTHCEFCGSVIEYSSIKEKIDSYTKNVKFVAESFFRESFNMLNDKIIAIKIILLKRESYKAQINQLESMFVELDQAIIELEKYTALLKYNSENISSIRKFEIQKFQLAVKDISNIAFKINQLRRATIDLEKAKLDKLGTLIKGAVSIAISDSTMIDNNLARIATNEKLVKQYTQLNFETYQNIKLLKESKGVTSDFMILVNEILEDINISIKLHIVGNDYYIRTTLLDKEELSVDDISEGEKNLLSLLFFYFEMFEDNKQTILKRDIRLIILDDPISSMDDSNRFYVLELVRNIVQLAVDQVFVLSHVWDDYCQLIYGRSCFALDSKYGSYEIRKVGQSIILRNNSQGNPYKFMFKEIYELSLKSSLSTDCEYFHIPNTIRKVFEEFLFFKTNKNTLAQNSNKAEIESMFSISTNNDKTKLGTLLSVSNVLSHTNTKTNDDILSAAKFLMKIIKDNDKLHFDAMKQ